MGRYGLAKLSDPTTVEQCTVTFQRMEIGLATNCSSAMVPCGDYHFLFP